VIFVITAFSSLRLPLIGHYFDIKENKLNRQKSNFIYLMRKEWKADYKASKTQHLKPCFHKIEKVGLNVKSLSLDSTLRVKSQKFEKASRLKTQKFDACEKCRQRTVTIQTLIV
jgi:hypothetical protein